MTDAILLNLARMDKCINCGRDLRLEAEGVAHFPNGICPICAEWVGAASMFLPDRDTSRAVEEPGETTDDAESERC